MKKNSLLFVVLIFIGCSSHDSAVEHKHRIVFFGDSITELGNKPDGYVSLLRDSLRTLGISAEVIGAGISGNKMTDLQRRLKTDVLSRKPTIVFIYIGINDVWHFQFSERGLHGTPKGEFKTILTKIVVTLQQSGTSVVLCTPGIIGEKIDGTNRWDTMLDEYSEITREIARDRSVILLDLRKEFLNYLQLHNNENVEKNILTYDGVHLNNNGNRFVAKQMFKIFEGLGLFFPAR